MHEQIILDPYARNVRWKLREDARAAPEPRRWPLPRIGAFGPRVIAAHAAEDRRGTDLGYGSTTAASGALVPVAAAQTGEVSSALETADGDAVSSDHGQRTWSTHYARLAQMTVTPSLPRLRRRQCVRSGEIIGYAARSPRHVRFELWQWSDARGFIAVDPTPYLPHWTITAAQPKPIRFAPKGVA